VVELALANGGVASASQVSPKLSVMLSPLSWLEMFINAGRGFHSNDARGATRRTDPADLLVAATGYEVGTALRPMSGLKLTAAAYALELDSEQVYVGDAGTTEPSDASRRYGVELTGTLSLSSAVKADAALTLNRAVYRANEGNAGSVALAPTRTLTGGITGEAPFGSFAALRVRHVGERAATEDRSIIADGWTTLSTLLGHRQGPFELELAIDNLLDAQWREVQFATESRLEDEAQPVEEIHFAPGWPFSATMTLRAYF
jgi:hypothetical protein